MRADNHILRVIDEAVAESTRKAGRWIACKRGCSECCHAAFPITMLDAARLRHGLAQAAPETAHSIAERAAGYRHSIRATFPGDWATGVLDDSEEWRDWFFERQKGQPCPVLDPASGECLLYEHRPVACRIYGHHVQVGAQPQTLCRLCFAGATQAEVDAAHVQVDEMADAELEPGHTIVALAVS